MSLHQTMLISPCDSRISRDFPRTHPRVIDTSTHAFSSFHFAYLRRVCLPKNQAKSFCFLHDVEWLLLGAPVEGGSNYHHNINQINNITFRMNNKIPENCTIHGVISPSSSEKQKNSCSSLPPLLALHSRIN
jgi:hypothetical protein